MTELFCYDLTNLLVPRYTAIRHDVIYDTMPYYAITIAIVITVTMTITIAIAVTINVTTTMYHCHYCYHHSMTDYY